MSVATKNPFAILDDDQVSESSPEPAQADVPPPPSNNRPTQKSRGGPAARGGKYYARGGKPSNPSDEPVAAAAAVDDSQKKFEGARDGRGRGGRGRARGGEGRGGEGRSGRRPYDRHSQTGKTDSDKKVHQAWGGDDGNTEFNTEQAATVDAAVESNNDWNIDPTVAAVDPATDWAGTGTADASADPWGATTTTAADDWGASSDPVPAPAGDSGKPEGRPRRDREPEEEDNTLTLSQYLAQQKEKESGIPKLENTRKANEGASDDLWKDVVPLSKNEEEDAYFVGKSKSAPKARPKKEDKVYLEIDARFERPDRRGRGRGDGRGDRGGDRGDRSRNFRGGGGGGGRGPPRSGAGGRQNGATTVDDQAAFPSLT